MASSGNTWQKKLITKDAKLASKLRYGSMVPLLARSKSTHAEKVIALKKHRELIVEHGYNPAPVYDGTGLPDETIKQPKPNAERAAKDKRAPLPMVAGWRPRPFGKKIAARQALGRNAI